MSQFEQAVIEARRAPAGIGALLHLVNRPSEGVHRRVAKLRFDFKQGIEGDRWRKTAWIRLPNGQPDPRVQVSLTNARVMTYFTKHYKEGIFGCGDNLYTDLSLTEGNLPVGSRLVVGSAVLQVSNVPNDAGGKFAQRFGQDAVDFIRKPENAPLRLRGVFCKIVTGGEAHEGDLIKKLS